MTSREKSPSDSKWANKVLAANQELLDWHIHPYILCCPRFHLERKFQMKVAFSSIALFLWAFAQCNLRIVIILLKKAKSSSSLSNPKFRAKLWTRVEKVDNTITDAQFTKLTMFLYHGSQIKARIFVQQKGR